MPKTPPTFPAPWTVDEEKQRAHARLRLKDFLHGVEVIGRIAGVAEELNHHPDIHLTRYDRLRVTTWSHDEGRLTGRDQALAKRLSALFDELGLKAR
jgi:4a-hydroxytetrahydrobiopterin dehydratase